MYHSQSHSQSHSAPPHTHCPSLSLRSVNGWVTLEVIIKALSDNELQVLDAYHEKNPSPIYEEERARLREEEPTRESDDDGSSDEDARGGGGVGGCSVLICSVLARSWLVVCMFLALSCWFSESMYTSPRKGCRNASGFVWICLDLSGCPDIQRLDIRMSGYPVWICPDMSGYVWICLYICVLTPIIIVKHLSLKPLFCSNGRSQALCDLRAKLAEPRPRCLDAIASMLCLDAASMPRCCLDASRCDSTFRQHQGSLDASMLSLDASMPAHVLAPN